jgi:hypothetical protein
METPIPYSGNVSAVVSVEAQGHPIARTHNHDACRRALQQYENGERQSLSPLKTGATAIIATFGFVTSFPVT